MFVDVGEELFLPGFPLGLSAGNFPIWKRASLASSTEFGFGIKRYIFVDTATREGMSGSPCLAIRNWRYRTLDRQSGKFGEADGPAVRLLGVYAGRLNPSDSFEAQIGMVWRENLIFDTISGRISATVRISG
jgi:hypothetical protein